MGVHDQGDRDPEQDRERRSRRAMEPGRDTGPASRAPPPPTSRRPWRRPVAPQARPSRSCGSFTRLVDRGPQRTRIVGRHQPRGAGRGHLAEAAHVADHDRLAEGERGGQHARPVQALGPRVRQHHDVGPAEERGQLGVGDESRDRSGRSGPARPPPATARAACAADPRPTARRRRPRARPRAACRGPCRGAAGRRTARPAPRRLASSSGSGSLVRLGGEVLERAVVDDPDLGRVDPEALDEQVPAVARVHDDRVDRVVEAALGAYLPGARLAREQVVGGEDGRPVGQQVAVDGLDGQPLEVDHVGRAGNRRGSGACRARARAACRPGAPASPVHRAHGGRTARAPRSRRARGRCRSRTGW